MDAALKKLFAKLDELGKRLDELDSNGKLDEIRKEMKTVAANSQIVVNVVESHGDTLAKLERTVERLHMRCPLLKHDTDEVPAVRLEAKRDRPSSSEYAALAVVAQEEDEPE
jgi:hypothetical protein